MNPRKRIYFLIIIMFLIVAVVESITITLLYRTAFNEEKQRLIETAKSQASLINSVANYDKIYSKSFPGGPTAATLKQIEDAHSAYKGFGETGEFTLSKKENNQIIFLLRHRHSILDYPKPITWGSGLAEPMHMALSGKSGTMIGRDYRGTMVLAAYEPVAVLNMGIVAKIDLSEIRKPFISAIIISAIIAVIIIAMGIFVFYKITNPILYQLHSSITDLEKALREVKTLRGIVPICSFCKKIRNDKGYWDQVEVYVTEHSEANFSHGICPECMAEHYPDFKMPDGILFSDKHTGHRIKEKPGDK
jgi:hypothetical protein